MKLGRLGRVLKWLGTAGCLGILLLFAACLVWAVVVVRVGMWNVGVASGAIIFAQPEQPRGKSMRFIPGTLGDRTNLWRVLGVRPTALGADVRTIPLWIPGALAAIPTALLWRLDRRRPAPGACRCGYDLTGNTSGRCPECGRSL
jgi:hypothetical protein